MRKEKGQDIIEYALMLAMVVGIGFGIYSYGGSGIGNSISSVFNNAGNLLDKAALPVVSSSDDIIKRLRDERYGGSSDILEKPAEGDVKDIAFDSMEGQELARKLNIQTKEGDGWYVRIFSPGTTVITYYSAADNGGVTFSQRQNDYASNPGKYGGVDSTGHYKTIINITEGYYNGTGKELYHISTKGHVEVGPNGGMSIYPGAIKAKS